MGLSYKQQGIYILLLSHSWRRPLPTEKELLHRLVPGARWSDIEKVVTSCFHLTPEGHANDKLLTLQRHAIDISDKASYAGKCSANKRLQPTDVERTLNGRSTNQNQNQNQDNNKPSKPRKEPFVIPTLEEVTAFCKQRNNGVNPEKFIAHYTNTGWRVGKAPGRPMKDWKAAIISTWEKDSPPSCAPAPSSKNREGFA